MTMMVTMTVMTVMIMMNMLRGGEASWSWWVAIGGRMCSMNQCGSAQIVYHQTMSNLQTVECFSFSYKHWVVLDLFSVFSVLLILVYRNLPVDNIHYAVYLSKCTG